MEGKKHENRPSHRKNKAGNAPCFRRITQKKPYNAITISELTREADIDRRTFYLHYECIEDLVSEMQQLARNMIAEQLKNCENVQLDTLFDGLTNVVRDKMDFYRVIFTEPSCSAFSRMVSLPSNTVSLHPIRTVHFRISKRSIIPNT